MTPEENNGSSAHDEEINTTAPQSKPEVWRMPEPVFRKTSGKLPGGFAKAIELETAERSTAPQSEPSDPPTGFTDQPEPKLKSPVLKIVVVALALAAMIAFITLFLSLLYFWFMRE